jgi:hypothetical protein
MIESGLPARIAQLRHAEAIEPEANIVAMPGEVNRSLES